MQKINLNHVHDKYSIFTQFLNSHEIDYFNAITNCKKQLEWFASRALIKHILSNKLHLSPQSIQVVKHLSGEPYIKNHPQVSVSISHSNEFVACTISTEANIKCTIDIEKIETTKCNDFMRVAFTDKERLHLDQCSNAHIYRNWTIKEAYLKYIGKGFHENLHAVEILENIIYHYNHKVENIAIQTGHFKHNYIYSTITTSTN